MWKQRTKEPPALHTQAHSHKQPMTTTVAGMEHCKISNEALLKKITDSAEFERGNAQCAFVGIESFRERE